MVGQKTIDHPEASESDLDQNCQQPEYEMKWTFKFKTFKKYSNQSYYSLRQTVMIGILLVLMSVKL